MARNFNCYVVISVAIISHKKLNILKHFPSKFPGIFANLFQRKIIPVYSMHSANCKQRNFQGEFKSAFVG